MRGEEYSRHVDLCLSVYVCACEQDLQVPQGMSAIICVKTSHLPLNYTHSTA